MPALTPVVALRACADGRVLVPRLGGVDGSAHVALAQQMIGPSFALAFCRARDSRGIGTSSRRARDALHVHQTYTLHSRRTDLYPTHAVVAYQSFHAGARCAALHPDHLSFTLHAEISALPRVYTRIASAPSARRLPARPTHAPHPSDWRLSSLPACTLLRALAPFRGRISSAHPHPAAEPWAEPSSRR